MEIIYLSLSAQMAERTFFHEIPGSSIIESLESILLSISISIFIFLSSKSITCWISKLICANGLLQLVESVQVVGGGWSEEGGGLPPSKKEREGI